MRKHMNVFALVFAVALAVPSLASAATFGAEVFGAFNSYAMGDINDAVAEANEGGADFNEISSGVTGGLALKLWANPNWMFSAGWEPLFAKTTDDAAVTESSLSLDGNSFQFTAGYFFPTGSTAKYGFAAGVGHYSLSGESVSGAVSQDVEGSGVGFHFMGLSEWTVSPGFAVNGGAGYRVAEVELDEAPDTFADYSGFMGRLGLSFYMPTR